MSVETPHTVLDELLNLRRAPKDTLAVLTQRVAGWNAAGYMNAHEWNVYNKELWRIIHSAQSPDIFEGADLSVIPLYARWSLAEKFQGWAVKLLCETVSYEKAYSGYSAYRFVFNNDFNYVHLHLIPLCAQSPNGEFSAKVRRMIKNFFHFP